MTSAPDLTADAQLWLDRQPYAAVRIAREIIHRRTSIKTLTGDQGWQQAERGWESGCLAGLDIALFHLVGYPGDIDMAGSALFVANVEHADRLCAEATAAAVAPSVR